MEDLRNLSINFDIYGNLYFSNDQGNYKILINKNNNLTLEKGDYKIIGHYNEPIYKIQNLDKKNSLRYKIDEERYEYENDSEEEEEIDYYNEDDAYVAIDEPNLEDFEMDDVDKNTFYDYGENNLKFIFWAPNDQDQIKVYRKQDENIMALYDTYIYDQKNELIFKSNSPDDTSIYRIKIYPTGEIFFRPIGNTDKKYSLKMLENELTLLC